MDSLEGMDSDLYGEDKSTDKPDSQKSVDQEENTDPQALVDLKVLTGKQGPPKEGDEIVVKVVSIHGDQAVIRYAPEKPGKGENKEPDEDDMSEINSKY